MNFADLDASCRGKPGHRNSEPDAFSRCRRLARGRAVWVPRRVGWQSRRHSAALLGFDLPKHTFIATATAIALLVDRARLPVYLVTQHEEIMLVWPWVALASAGVCVGTVLGSGVMARIPEIWFRRVLAAVLALLGAAMVLRGIRV